MSVGLRSSPIAPWVEVAKTSWLLFDYQTFVTQWMLVCCDISYYLLRFCKSSLISDNVSLIDSMSLSSLIWFFSRRFTLSIQASVFADNIATFSSVLCCLLCSSFASAVPAFILPYMLHANPSTATNTQKNVCHDIVISCCSMLILFGVIGSVSPEKIAYRGNKRGIFWRNILTQWSL